ncbi:hypothetical protein HMPREF1254_0622 [Prevotella sp. BV3P1]|uniref:hypothetical protein n=1 Tax=Prevotellaceae TaxID=171552 RepID=UPI0003B80B57|nr:MULTISPECIES: hypothetical protein [Prevotellaceae]ERT60311.1 hypothetical protein HMPREF1254_0622 [Prevotella sp. BV3P1]KGF39132.1 hypothetical protein HMPREF2140_10905 [Hoylesella buccalis DNF00985]
MAINHSNISNFNSSQWHIVVQQRDTPSRFEAVVPTSTLQGIVTRIVHVDRLSELLIKAVNNRTRERNYFKKLVELFQGEVTEEEFDKAIEENEDDYVVTADGTPSREDLMLACEAAKQIKDVRDIDDFAALFSFNPESTIKEIEAK